MNKKTGHIPDEVLVVAAILGDLHAFDELVKRYRGAVLGMVRSIVGESMMEDVAQEAWLLAFKALPSVDHPEKFASWLMVLARNRALRSRAQENRHTSRHIALDAFLLEKIGSIGRDPNALSEEKEFLQVALNALPEEYGLVLQMRFIDEMPLKRIASFLDVPLSTVKWRVFNGKKLLRKELKKQE